ncbi:MAG: M12 family metallo-peptidase, partial [Bacteroidota bacterium]
MKKLPFISLLWLFLFCYCPILSAQGNNFIHYPDEQSLDLTQNVQHRLLSIRNRPSSVSVHVLQFKNLELIGTQQELLIPIKGVGQFRAITKKVKDRGNSRFFWSGQFQENKGTAFFAIANANVTGMIHIGQLVFSIEPIGAGNHALIELDQSKFGPDEPPNTYSGKNEIKDGQALLSKNAISGSFGAKFMMTTPVIDVMVAYTAAVANANGNMSSFIDACIESANETFANSGVGAELSLIHSVQVNYSESGSTETDVGRLQGASDGHMDNLHSLRDEYGADIVVLLIANADANGEAFGIEVQSSGAFCVVLDDAAVPNYTFAHEIGHLIGCRHDRNADGNGSYNHGYVYSSGGWRTVMALPYSGITRIPFWSNPDSTYGEVAMGTTTWEDNARKWNERASTVASFYLRPILVPGDYSTIESALSAASSGYRVIVSADTYTINSNATVVEGVTLELAAGCTLNFAGNYKLRVEGRLEANGSTSDTIQFTRSGGTWYGIEFYSGTSGSTIQYAKITNAQYGVYNYNTNATVSYSHIENNTTGVYSSNNSSTLAWNRIQSNTYGVQLASYGDANIQTNNVLRYNGYAVHGDATSVPAMGNYPGNNSIYSNDYYDVYSGYGGTIYAQGNWWGSYPASPSIFGTVDYSSELSSNPNTWAGKLVDPAKGPILPGPLAKRSNSPGDDSGMKKLDEAYRILLSGDTEHALGVFLSIVARYPDAFAGARALVFAYQILEKAGRDAKGILTSAIARSPGSKVGSVAKFLLTGHLVKEGDNQTALNNALALVDHDDTLIAKHALYDAGNILWYRLTDKEAGSGYFRK